MTEIAEPSVTQLPKENIGSSYSGYSMEISGKEGTIILSGGASPHEGHQMYCNGDSEWEDKAETVVSEYFDGRETHLSKLRTYVTGECATVLSVSSAMLVGYMIVSVTPGNIIHYYPTLSDALAFFTSLSIYLSIRFRDWVFPYIRVNGLESISPVERLKEILYASLAITALLILIRSIVGTGPIITI